ncbi:oxidoreductase [Pseudomonas kuykendallii]|uniref:Short-chain dehydrogenase n=1 Tax=Pseudomonas kuykendallii TaxID=1007099 RepID=A0A1H2Z8W2_9PSED|nr:oxidoreductase [Pseudomonas kuykendallii]MCQ4271559.1 oxidoreductase [Pseudomonas kuykendallii]SDX13767.1 Short-chain dehydrogenase [Pseudomonas kuykendallii]
MHDSDSKLFFISGVSSGFGRAFAEAALAAGHRVVGSLRSAADLQAFEQDPSGRAFGVLLDVTDDAAIDAAIAGVERDHGPIDVLVNNAGYGHEGILEESPLAELRHQFDVNLFGAVALIKAVLPGMRQRRSGRIINITSMGGFITLPGIAYYCGSKFALEGISETLASEVRDFGIFVTAVAPGSFRTDWAGRSLRRSERSIADYDALFEPIRAARESKSGRQNGDPRKAAQVLLQLVAMESPPTHLLLGSDALQLVQAKLAALQDEIARYAELSRSTDF